MLLLLLLSLITRFVLMLRSLSGDPEPLSNPLADTNVVQQVTASGTLPSARCYHTSFLHEGKMYSFGGVFGKQRFNDMYTLSLGVHGK